LNPSIKEKLRARSTTLFCFFLLAIANTTNATAARGKTSFPAEPEMTSLETRQDEFRGKGAVEQESPEQDGNLDFKGQLGHRNQGPLIKQSDTDYPEPGENPEHSGEPTSTNLKSQDQPNRKREEDDPEGETQDMDPGQRQKENQSGEEEDPLAA
jgi:hypothetical protein